MIELKKTYRVKCSRTILRHEAKILGFFFHERIRRDGYGLGEFNSREEAEAEIKNHIEEYNIKESWIYPEGTSVVEKDPENNLIKLTLYTAFHRNYFRDNSNVFMKRKKNPYFTIYLHYSILECTYGYNDDEESYKTDTLYDKWDDREFETPSYIGY